MSFRKMALLFYFYPEIGILVKSADFSILVALYVNVNGS